MPDSRRQPRDPAEYMRKVRPRTTAAIPYALVVMLLVAVIDQLTVVSPLLAPGMITHLALTGLISLFVIKPHVNHAFDRWTVIALCVVVGVLSKSIVPSL
jgi:hypothetical protein